MNVNATLTANVWKILVKHGQEVHEGDQLMILESMKMEIPVEAPASGRIVNILCVEGDQVEEDQPLVELG